MAYSADTFTSLEQPTLAKWNKLWANDAAFNDGTGLPSANAARAIVNTTETTASTSYVQLTTATDFVTVTVGATGKVIILARAMTSNTGVNYNYLAVAFSGANTLTAANAETAGYYSQEAQASGSNVNAIYLNHVYSGLTPGSTTFSMYYKTSAGTASFKNRIISVIPL